MTALGSVHVQSDNVRYGRGHLTPHRGNQARPPTGSCPIYYSCPIDHTMTIPLVILSRDDVQVIRVRMQWLNCRKKVAENAPFTPPFLPAFPCCETVHENQFKHCRQFKLFNSSNTYQMIKCLTNHTTVSTYY